MKALQEAVPVLEPILGFGGSLRCMLISLAL
jgi:hypothetical protein